MPHSAVEEVQSESIALKSLFSSEQALRDFLQGQRN